MSFPKQILQKIVVPALVFGFGLCSVSISHANRFEDERQVWVNQTYKTRIAISETAGVWEEFRQRDGAKKFTLKELARNNEYIEMLLVERNQVIRLHSNKLTMLQDGKWNFVAGGYWQGRTSETHKIKQRKQWINKTYKTKISEVEKVAKKWEERNLSDNEKRWNLKELGQTDEYVELLLIERNQKIRLFKNQMLMLQNGSWVFVAGGHWARLNQKPSQQIIPDRRSVPPVIPTAPKAGKVSSHEEGQNPFGVVDELKPKNLGHLEDKPKSKDFGYLTRNWRNLSNTKQFFGTLETVVNDVATITDRDQKCWEISFDRFSPYDQELLNAIEGLDVTSSEAELIIRRLGARIDFLRTTSTVRTKDGFEFKPNEVASISPYSLEIRRPSFFKSIEIDELEAKWQDQLHFNAKDAEDYKNARRELRKKYHQARKNYGNRNRTDRKLPSDSPTSFDTPIFLTKASKGHVWVSGHFRDDGTWVKGHFRTHPNDDFNDNWSTVGNINPYTGKRGTKKRPYATQSYARQIKRSASTYRFRAPIQRASYSPRYVWVNSYYRKDGTFVRGHYRSAPRR